MMAAWTHAAIFQPRNRLCLQWSKLQWSKLQWSKLQWSNQKPNHHCLRWTVQTCFLWLL